MIEKDLIEEIYELKYKLFFLEVAQGLKPLGENQSLSEKLEEYQKELEKEKYERFAEVITSKQKEMENLTDRQILEKIYYSLNFQKLLFSK